MKISKRYKTSRIPCPICGDHYLQSAYGRENKKFVRIGVYCPGCGYIKSEQNESKA